MNSVNVKITGLNLIRIVDRLVAKNVCVSNLQVKPKSIRFSIDENKLQILNNICKKEHKFYQIIHKNGFRQMLSRIPYMFGAVLALILIFTYMFSYSLFIVSVDVSYNSNLSYDLSKVNSLLEQSGIVVGMKKNTFSISEIQNLILQNIDDVEGCEVRFSGNNISICVYPATTKYEVNTENIYSLYNAIIVEAEAYAGTLKVKVGDLVSKNDVLIENKNGASGKVTGKVYFTSTKIYNENQKNIIYTGNTYKVRDYLICNKFSIKGENNCSFSNYLVENCSFYVAKNLFLPILCNETTYIETEIEDVVIPFESVEEEIKKELYNEAKSIIEDENTITNVTYSIVTEGCYTRVDCFIEVVISLF